MSTVFYSSLKCRNTVSPLTKIKKLFNRCGAKDIYSKNDIVAIKVHFGEMGNTAFLRPIYLRPILEALTEYKTKPYLTDTNTLYTGMRSNSVDHIHNANLNGFGYSTLQTPIIIADGIRGEDYAEISIPGGKLEKSAKIATGILSADAMVVVSHFKGHDITGFGGAIKNLSMGCASRAGKLVMHCNSKPVVHQAKCTACGRCLVHCQVKAIKISGKAVITDKCIGCTRCVGVCPQKAIGYKYDNSNESVMKLMTEYAAATCSAFAKPIIFINILTSISPSCDCMPGNDAPVTSDIGFMSSTDPVAIDAASYDLVKKYCGGHNPFTEEGDTQLKYAKEIGFWKNNYEIKQID